jgi:hypothetical protein
MFGFIRKIINPKVNESTVPHDEESIWSIVANIKKEIPYGPQGSEIKSGLKKFKAGAKVHIIGAFYGMGEDIIVMGQHRKSGKYISCVIKVNTVENLRVKKIYSKKILELLKNDKDYQIAQRGFSSKEKAEELAILIPKWVLQL